MIKFMNRILCHTLLILCCLILACGKNRNIDKGLTTVEPVQSYELNVISFVDDTLQVSVISGDDKIDVGYIKGKPSKGTTKGVLGARFDWASGCTVAWLEKGNEYVSTFKTILDIGKIKEVKSIDIVYHGGGKWTLMAYNDFKHTSNREILFVQEGTSAL